VPESLHPWIKDYLIGLLSARIGENEEALRRADVLEAAREPRDPEGLRPDLAREIRALVAFQSQRFSEALEIVEQSTYGLTNNWQTFSAGFYRRPTSRLLRAATLEKLGREDEALGWYAGFFVSELAIDLVFTGPVHLRMARIHDRNGNHEMAARHYRCFIARWQGADPEYEPLLNEARSRQAELDQDNRSAC
jgi:tetratricopeptide (TPR) repeat protein